MVATFEQLADDVATLPRQQRLALARLLLDVEPHSPEADREWEDEIRTRVKAIDDGKAVGIPYEQIKQEMRARFRHG